MTDEALQPERRLDIEGTYNLRDLGGYPTRQGRRTRWKQFLRSDSLHAVTEVGQSALKDYGLRVIIDLRSTLEIEHKPNVFANSSSVDYRHLPVVDAVDNTSIPEDRRHQGVGAGYRNSVDHYQSCISAIMMALAEPQDGAKLYHCAGGKDRTGLISTLLLGLADVSPELIAADYAVTARYNIHSFLAMASVSQSDPQEIRTWQDYEQHLCPPEAMLSTLQYLDEHYGGVESYVRRIGLSDKQINQLRKQLVE